MIKNNFNRYKTRINNIIVFNILTIVFIIPSNIFPQVIKQWVVRYNGSTSLGSGNPDKADAIVVDNLGNAYVTGNSWYPETNTDIVTIKYNAFGEQQWLAKYNGPENSEDYGVKIVIDDLGNTYVTGYRWITGTGREYDYVTIKYNQYGIEQWSAIYNGDGNSEDKATSICTDVFNNVYVTGSSYVNNNERDYCTIKYDSNGMQQWINKFDAGSDDDNAVDIAADNQGNVYVTGSGGGYGTGSGYDYVTIKINFYGNIQWISKYNGTANWSDTACAISIDDSGNVYVTGSSFGSENNVESYTDYVTIKYNNDGIQQWVSRYNGPGNYWDNAYAMILDNFGNVYVTGGSDGLYGYSTFYDYATIKYNNNGIQQWIARYNGPGNDWDQATAIALDNFENIYVTGWIDYTGLGAYDYCTIKYNKNGEQQWVDIYNGTGNFLDDAEAIATDKWGNVYVTGTSWGKNTGDDYLTIKYSAYKFSELFSLY